MLFASDDRSFDEEAIQEYLELTEFDYSRSVVVADDWFSQMLRGVMNWIGSLFGAAGGSMTGKNILLIVMVLILIGAAFYVAKMRFQNALSSGGHQIMDPHQEEEFSQDVNYEELLKSSLKDADLSSAVKFLYLHTLQRLNGLQEIEVVIWKSPLEYLYELPSRKKTDFEAICRLYEKTRYGHYQPKEVDLQVALEHLNNITIAKG